MSISSSITEYLRNLRRNKVDLKKVEKEITQACLTGCLNLSNKELEEKIRKIIINNLLPN